METPSEIEFLSFCMQCVISDYRTSTGCDWANATCDITSSIQIGDPHTFAAWETAENALAHEASFDFSICHIQQAACRSPKASKAPQPACYKLNNTIVLYG